MSNKLSSYHVMKNRFENYNWGNKTKAEGCAWDAAESRSDMGEWKYEAQDFNPPTEQGSSDTI